MIIIVLPRCHDCPAHVVTAASEPLPNALVIDAVVGRVPVSVKHRRTADEGVLEPLGFGSDAMDASGHLPVFVEVSLRSTLTVMSPRALSLVLFHRLLSARGGHGQSWPWSRPKLAGPL